MIPARRRPYTPGEIVFARLISWGLLAGAAALLLWLLRWCGVEWLTIGQIAACGSLLVVGIHIVLDVDNDSEWQ